jgi:hypothetical protein
MTTAESWPWGAPTDVSPCAIDRAQSCYLCEPSLPVRQHASSRRNDDSARPNLGSFFPKPRCARQVDQTRRRMPSSSSTSAEAATTGLPSLRRPTVRLLRSKHRLIARHAFFRLVRLMADMPFNARCAHRRQCGGSFALVLASVGRCSKCICCRSVRTDVGRRRRPEALLCGA